MKPSSSAPSSSEPSSQGLRLVGHANNVRPLAKCGRTLASARLRHAIIDAGLTQEEAGRLIGVDSRQVRRWLSGEVSLGPLELLAKLEAKLKGAA